MGRSQRHRVEEQGFSARGAIYEEGAINDQILGRLSGSIANLVPVLTSINPSTAVKGSAAFTLQALGSSFDANCAIRVNGAPVTTALVSPTELTCSITPPAGMASWSIQVQKAGAINSEVKMLTFTDTELGALVGRGPSQQPGGDDERDHGPFNLLRIEPDEDGGVWYVFDRIDIRDGDEVRVEAAGSSSVNGDFTVVDISNDVEGETAIYREGPEIQADIVGKGRITIL